MNQKEIIERYVNGECDVFAVALYKAKGWPVFMLADRCRLDDPYGAVHLFAMPGPGVVFDIEGESTIQHVLDSYGSASEAYTVDDIKPVTPEWIESRLLQVPDNDLHQVWEYIDFFDHLFVFDGADTASDSGQCHGTKPGL